MDKKLLDDHLAEELESNINTKNFEEDSNWLIRPFILFFIWFGLGALGAFLRPYADVNGTHYEALVFIVLLVLMTVLVFLYINKSKFEKPLTAYSISVAMVWFGYGFGWGALTLVLKFYFLEDMLIMNAFGAGIAIVIGCAVLKIKSLSS